MFNCDSHKFPVSLNKAVANYRTVQSTFLKNSFIKVAKKVATKVFKLLHGKDIKSFLT